MATIKELSDSIGISKVGLTKWIERNGYKGRLDKVGNKYVIPADIEQVIRAYFDRKEPKKAEPVQTTIEPEKDITSEILALLREQLEAKDREIERLHQQVDDLQKINADIVKAVRELNTLHALQLTDGSEREPVQDQQRSKSEARESEPAEQRANNERRSFWQRLKGKF